MGNIKNRLIIIGNGFDLAHKLLTSYDSFVKASGGTQFHDLVLRLFGNNSPKINKWSRFEKRMRNITEKIFESCEPDELFKRYLGKYWNNWDEYIDNLDGFFINLSNELKAFLSQEVKKKIICFSSVEQYLNDSAYIINFNYTSTAEKYTKDIYYVHGSLKENDILLGYDHHIDNCFTGETDIMEPMLIRRNKRFMREALSYRRFLRNRGINEQSVIQEGNSYLDYLANKAVDMAGAIGDFHGLLFSEYIESRRGTADIPIAIDFDSIKEIVIIGHSLASDKMFIRDSLIRKSNNLEQIVLFSYDGESVNELFKKIRFLNKAVPNKRIKICYY